MLTDFVICFHKMDVDIGLSVYVAFRGIDETTGFSSLPNTKTLTDVFTLLGKAVFRTKAL
jgi:hypothetical protein